MRDLSVDGASLLSQTPTNLTHPPIVFDNDGDIRIEAVPGMEVLKQCVDIKEFLWQNTSDLTYLTSTMGIFFSLYSVIIILGVFGNGLVIISVLRHRNLQSVRNIFIVALSTSDIIAIVFSGFITPITGFSKVWLFGNFLCKLVPLIQGSSLCFSTLTLTAIAIDRFILIIFPTRRSINRQLALLMIAVNCLIALSVSLPMYFKQTLREYMDFCGEFCAEDWHSNDQGRSIYGTFVFFVQFVIPFCIILTCYLMIWLRLNHSVSMINKRPKPSSSSRLNHTSRSSNQNRSAKKCPPLITKSSSGTEGSTIFLNGNVTRDGSGKRSSSSLSILELRNQAVIRRRIKTNRMLIAMVAQFGLCWTPAVVFNFLRDYQWLPDFIHGQEYLAGILTHCISISSTLWNPILYALFNEHFRTAFVELFHAVQRFICTRSGDESRQGEYGRWSKSFGKPSSIFQEISTFSTRTASAGKRKSPGTGDPGNADAGGVQVTSQVTSLSVQPSEGKRLQENGAVTTVEKDAQRQAFSFRMMPPQNGFANKERRATTKADSIRRLSVISSRSGGSLSSQLSLSISGERQTTPMSHDWFSSYDLTQQEGDEML